jgi:signal transduction histidine kinase
MIYRLKQWMGRAKMHNWQAGDVLDAAVQTMINERCRQAYMHDMRGGLQAIYSSIELLARSAKNGAQNPALVDSAASLAKRAMANHDQSVGDIVNQVTGPDGAPAILNLADLVRQSRHFLRNDALARSITVSLSGPEEMLVLSERNKLRSMLLGLLAACIDALPPGADLHLELSCADRYAVLELRSTLTYEVIREAQEIFCREPVNLGFQELVLGSARRWIMSNGGRMEISPSTDGNTTLRILYPLAA